jgi:hypothetical protein
MANMEWIDLGNGRKLLRKVGPMSRGPRSDLACPNVIKPFSEPVQSMADGRFYDHPRDLERTYRADGNPSGQEFIPLGNEKSQGVEYTLDPKQRRNDIKQALHDVQTGNVSAEIAAIE